MLNPVVIAWWSARMQETRVWLACMVVAQLVAGGALAQPYPNKPVHVLVGVAPGGGTDIVARVVANKLTQNTGQQFIVDNRTGAAGAIATELVAKATPDGYTLLVVSSNAVILSALRAKLSYDLDRDFKPVALMATLPLVLVVNPAVPVRNVKELIALARSRPGQLHYASSGVGSVGHLAAELTNLMGQVNIQHIPYKGGSQNMAATISGEVEMVYTTIPGAISFIQDGRLRALGVTSKKPATLLPSVPSLDEAGLTGYDYTVWHGVLAPVRVADRTIMQLNSAIVQAVNAQDTREFLVRQGIEPAVGTPEQFRAFLRSETVQLGKLVKIAGLKDE